MRDRGLLVARVAGQRGQTQEPDRGRRRRPTESARPRCPCGARRAARGRSAVAKKPPPSASAKRARIASASPRASASQRGSKVASYSVDAAPPAGRRGPRGRRSTCLRPSFQVRSRRPSASRIDPSTNSAPPPAIARKSGRPEHGAGLGEGVDRQPVPGGEALVVEPRAHARPRARSSSARGSARAARAGGSAPVPSDVPAGGSVVVRIDEVALLGHAEPRRSRRRRHRRRAPRAAPRSVHT